MGETRGTTARSLVLLLLLIIGGRTDAGGTPASLPTPSDKATNLPPDASEQQQQPVSNYGEAGDKPAPPPKPTTTTTNPPTTTAVPGPELSTQLDAARQQHRTQTTPSAQLNGVVGCDCNAIALLTSDANGRFGAECRRVKSIGFWNVLLQELPAQQPALLSFADRSVAAVDEFERWSI
uniref:Uncharacterized protein n=1 Tax=Anopheles farauti TaxID=69004 RepID=A0A182QSG1_9DIPT